MMEYALLLWPHANPRYADSLAHLALGETRCLLLSQKIDACPHIETYTDAKFIRFQTPELTDDAQKQFLKELSMLSCAYFYAAIETHGAQELLRPLDLRGRSAFPNELSEVLKYKGKTNAAFTRLMLNLALMIGRNSSRDVKEVLDPLCGRGTSLFVSLERGLSAVGIERSESELKAGIDYLKRYLQYNRVKHNVTHDGLTLPGGKNAPRVRFHLNEGPGGALDAPAAISFIHGDTLCADRMVRPACGVLISDLPYGVQHSGTIPLKDLAQKALPVWRNALTPGSGMAIAFNTYTLPRAFMVSAAQHAGFDVLDDPPYNGFAHWVEQAVNRDIVLARVPGGTDTMNRT